MLKIGDSFTLQKEITDYDVRTFAEISGDKNPLHLDDEYAKTTMFKQRIAHGMLSAGVISAAIGMHLPGIGTTYLSQSLQFKKPVFIGDTISVVIEVANIVEKKKFNIATLKTTVKDSKGDVVVEGEATVIPPVEEK